MSGTLWKHLIAWLISSFVVTSSWAQIKIGQTVGLTGAVAATVRETVAGARLYLDHVNATGGVLGESVELITLDDRFDVKQAAENARILMEDKQVIALFLNRGTPHTEAIMPLLEKHRVPLIAPSTGAMLLRKPVQPYIFNVRSSYQREAEKIIDYFHTVQNGRIAIVQVDDSFGADAVEGAQAGFAKNKSAPVLVLKVDRNQPDYGQIVPALTKANPQAVLWVGSGTAVSDGIRAVRTAGLRAVIATLSNNASDGFIQMLGTWGQGVIVAQAFPSERSLSYGLVRQAQALAKPVSLTLTPAMLEGFAAAKVLVEGLKQAGKNPTRARLLAALNRMGRFDLGGLVLNYSATDHTGLQFVDLSIVGSDGLFRR